MEDSGISDATGQPQSLPAAAVNTVPSPLSNSSGSNGRSNRESPMSQSVDDSFTHVPPARMVSSVSKSQYSQVVFHDVSDLYPTDCDIKCRYTLTSDVSAQPGDKIALFKVGWTSVTEYITFTRAPQPTVGETTLAVTIKADKFPKETSDLYQLCYITSGNVIAGGSIPFSFHVPTEAELVAVEDPTDPGMVVFRSRVSQLQDNLQKKSDDYDQLLLKHTLLEGNVQLLKRELDSVDSSLKKSQDAFTDLFTSKQELEIDNKVLQERLIQFQQETHTIGKLEEELSQSQKELETLRRQFEENNKNLVAAKKENIELVANLSKNYEVAQEKARQVETLTSSVACLQQDCERTTQALKEQVKVVESLTAQNESLVEKLRTMAAKHNETVMQNIELNEKVRGAEKATADALKANNRLQSMVEELRNSNSGGTGESAHAARASKLAEEKEMLEVMLLTLEEEHAKCTDQISNLTTQLSNLNVEPNRPTGPEQGNSHPNGPASSIFKVVRNATFGLLNGSPENAQSVSSNAPTTPPGSADESIEAVRSRLKAVREQKSVLGSELAILRHNMEIVESELKTLRQDHSAKKNRIEVLEIELRAAKDELTKLKKRKPEKASHSGANDHLEDVDAFKCGLPIIKKFNEQVAVLSLLQEKLDGERKENAELKNKVDDLLSKDAELCAELLDIREKFAAASNEVNRLREMPVRENFDMLNMALDNCEKSRKELEEKLMEEIQAKVKLEQQVTSLRAECVGKVSIDCSQQMQKRINSLEVQLDQQTKFTNYMKQFVHSTFNEQPTMPIRCPLCPTDFVPALRKTFAAHFKDQHMK